MSNLNGSHTVIPTAPLLCSPNSLSSIPGFLGTPSATRTHMIDSLIFFAGISLAGFALLCAILLTATRSVVALAHSVPDSDTEGANSAFADHHVTAPVRH